MKGKELAGPHHPGHGENRRGGAPHHDEMSGGKGTNRWTDGEIAHRVLVITPEAGHATATGGVIGVMMVGIDTTREGVPALMIGTGGGLHEGLLHLADQVCG